MSEIKLQSDIAREFSVRYPNKRGQFFHVSNERNNKIQAFQAKSIGVFPGVSDFLFFQKTDNPIGSFNRNVSTTIVAIEVKEPGSRHEVEQIERQIEWAEILESQGGIWRLCRSVDEAISCTQMDFKGLTIADVKEMLKSIKTKSIKF